MKKIAISSLFALMLLLVPLNTAYAGNDKVTICHATSSGSNPWVRIVTSINGINGHFENNGTPKAGHEGDLLIQGEADCPETPAVPEFGLIPGVVALLSSGGAFFFLKKRYN